MKITICGSIKFADKFVETYRQLESLGHEPKMHEHMFGLADGSAKDLIAAIKKDHGQTKRDYNLIKYWHDLIKNSDAVLVLNYDKNDIKNYIGGNTLMEMGFANVNDKKVYLMNPIPEMSYTDEIKAMVDVILNGDLSKI